MITAQAASPVMRQNQTYQQLLPLDRIRLVSNKHDFINRKKICCLINSE
ncbi:Putative uncharacterized protein [Moritella viscosa]|nr:Putative uncharacterized protein [Moritella viscosa]